MKILFLLQEFPYPATNGVRWKAFSLLSGLSQSHTCHVLAFADAEAEGYVQEFQRKFPRISVLGLFRPQPRTKWSPLWGLLKHGIASAAPFESPEFSAALSEALRDTDYDAVHIDMINMSQYGEITGKARTVLSVNDAVSRAYRTMLEPQLSLSDRFTTTLSALAIQLHERRVYPDFEAVHVVSKVDQDYLQTRCLLSNVEQIELSVEPGYLNWNGGDEDPYRLVLPANLSHPIIRRDVQTFIEGAYFPIKQRFSCVRMTILGPGGDTSFSNGTYTSAGIECVGWVDDYRQAIGSAGVAVIPETCGAGTKNRVIQSMALGRAVVLSPESASGVGAQDEHDYLVCRSSEEFIEAFCRLFAAPRFARQLGANARAFIQERHDPKKIISKWEALYRRVSKMKPVACSATRTGPCTQVVNASSQHRHSNL